MPYLLRESRSFNGLKGPSWQELVMPGRSRSSPLLTIAGMAGP